MESTQEESRKQAKREAKKRRKQLRQELKEKATVREEGSWEFREVRKNATFCAIYT